MYKISTLAYENAKKYNVTIKPSTRKGKKIDVFNKDGKKVASIGDINYLDYAMYIKRDGKAYADSRRKIYNIRHASDKNKPNSPGFFSSRLLWN